MGLFNFIYKLTNILSNKRKIKVFVIVVIIIFLLFFWSRGAFAAEPTPEQTQALTNYQLLLQESFANYLDYMITYNKINNQSSLNALFVYLQSQHLFVVPGTPGDTLNNRQVQYKVYLYTANNNDNSPSAFTIDADWSIDIASGTQYPCKVADFVGNVWTFYNFAYTDVQKPTDRVATNFYLPDACYLVRSTKINDLLIKYGYKTDVTSTYKTSDTELQAITSSGFQNQVTAINNATSAINDVNSSVEDVNQSVMDMINTIVDPYVNVTQEQLPQSNVQDSTEDGLDNIFIIIKNAFTGTPQSVSFPVPFTDNSFTIEPGFTENSMRKGGLSAMVSVIHLYWYYRIYSFIFLKYVELLEKLKEGEFEETVGNIKKEVL